MRRFPILALAVLLNACQVTPLTGPTSARRTAAPDVHPSPTATPVGLGTSIPQATPSAGATVFPTAAPTTAPPQLLLKPSEPVTAMTGRIALDASYMVAAGAGNVISHNGGLIVAAGGGNIVAAGGGNIVAAGGGNIVAAGGGNMVAAGGGNALPTGDRYHLLLSPPAPTAAPLKAGDVIPAAGMALTARSLRTGEPLPLGVDAQGNKVYAIYTNAEGGYSIYLPASEAGNVLLEATVPGTADKRLDYALIADTRTASAATPDPAAPTPSYGNVLDDDTRLTTQYIRTSLTGRLAEIFISPNTEALIARIANDFTSAPLPIRTGIGTFVSTYRTAAIASGLSAATPAEAEIVASRCVEILLANSDLNSVMCGPDTYTNWQDQPVAPALQEMTQVLTHGRKQMVINLASDPAFFASWHFSETAVRMKGFVPVRASDPCDFIVGEYLVSNSNSALPDAGLVLDWAHAKAPLPGAKIDQGERMHGAALALVSDAVQQSFLDPAATLDAVKNWKAVTAAAAAR